MLQLDPGALLRKLNRPVTQALEAAAGVALSRGHYEVSVEHLLAQLVTDVHGDVNLILAHYGVDAGRLSAALTRQLEGERSGNSGRPVFSPLLLNWLRDAWMLASVEQRLPAIRSGALLATLVAEPYSYTSASFVDLLAEIPRDELRRNMASVASGSAEDEAPPTGAVQVGGAAGARQVAGAGAHSRGPDTALGKFTQDFTAQARAGELDPVVGREAEIRQCIDILARRRKNNPIVVGEAGVGKTALVEGIAQRIVDGDVPELLKNVDLLGLDMGLLQAGASVKGEFENRLRGVIEEVQASPKPIVLFIDEAHTLIGAGGPAGGSDAANLLKPALARGELRTVAATTWGEYKKYFEKDAALTRRFQLVKLDEPSEENAVAMMRGLTPHYEKGHKVAIRDAGVVAAVELSSRYISGRQLPDKAVDLLDTCAARVSIARDAKPPALADLDHRIQILEREDQALRRELAEGQPVERRVDELAAELVQARAEREALATRWQKERELVERISELRAQLRSDEDQPAGDTASTLAATEAELAEMQGKDPLVPLDVTPELVASVVSDWTGIPVGKMVQDQAAVLLELEGRLQQRIRGQDHALAAIGEGIRASKLGLGNPRAPLGVFLLVGPSGVGKTETGLALADLLFGGERFVVTINMSEFQEKHTVSRLIGSPPGYVGYGEGGVLTEAVRQRPYSAVLLDEVEKADPEVMNLFYQVFDKGQLSDGEGRVIDFRNTVLLLTSNLGSDRMSALVQEQGQEAPIARERVLEAIRPVLVRHFKPALLARMTLVPYYPLANAAMREIVDLKLDQLKARLRETHRVELEVDDAVAQSIIERCAEVESGARNIDHILSRTLLPLISREILARMSSGTLPERFKLGLGDEGYTLVA